MLMYFNGGRDSCFIQSRINENLNGYYYERYGWFTFKLSSKLEVTGGGCIVQSNVKYITPF